MCKKCILGMLFAVVISCVSTICLQGFQAPQQPILHPPVVGAAPWVAPQQPLPQPPVVGAAPLVAPQQPLPQPPVVGAAPVNG